MSPVTHTIVANDTLTPLAAQLKQKNASGVLESVTLTGKTVKFKMVSRSGTTKVAETTTGVSVTSASDGKVQYDFQAADVNTPGTYYAYFVAYSGSESDTFPIGRNLIVEIMPDE